MGEYRASRNDIELRTIYKLDWQTAFLITKTSQPIDYQHLAIVTVMTHLFAEINIYEIQLII